MNPVSALGGDYGSNRARKRVLGFASPTGPNCSGWAACCTRLRDGDRRCRDVVAIIAAVEGGERAVTVNLATDFLAPARGDIIAAATLLKVGRRLVVGSVDTRTDDGMLVAVHRVTYAMPRRA